MNIKDYIHIHRKKANLTQEKLAEMLNVAHTTISNYENGVSTPNIYTLLQLSEFFNAPLTELCDADEYKPLHLIEDFMNIYGSQIPKNAQLMPVTEDICCDLISKNDCLVVKKCLSLPNTTATVITSFMKGKPYLYKIVKLPQFHVLYPLGKEKGLTPLAVLKVPDDLMEVVSVVHFFK
ncbi:MAG: helix-turn-helix transcriptional regulator [Clostridia bacterium]|nr:helix-turn-helix transcriptional regulator [Clostridia bacterium]